MHKLNGHSSDGKPRIYVSQSWYSILSPLWLEMKKWWTFEKSKAHCDLKWGSDGHLKKVKTDNGDNGRQVIAKLKLLPNLTLIISSYNLLGNNKQFNYNTHFHNTNTNLFLKYLATKTIESKINYPFIVLHEILVATI